MTPDRGGPSAGGAPESGPPDERDPDVLLRLIGGREGIAEMTRRVREDRGLSRAEFAGRMGRRARFLEPIENGRGTRDMHLSTVMLLARAGEVSIGLFVASYARPKDDPLPWPREHRPPRQPARARQVRVAARALGATLRHIRVRQKNWPQQQLSDLSGMTQGYLSQLELGHVLAPRLLTVVRLGRTFGTTPAERIAYATQLAQSYAGEITAPRLGRPYAAWRRRPT